MMDLCAKNLAKFDFEARRDAVAIFLALLKQHIGARYPAVDHTKQNPEILFVLLQSYGNSAVSLNCGTILREAFHHEDLVRLVLSSHDFWLLFDCVSADAFDVASDAITTFRMLLRQYPAATNEFLLSHYDEFFARYSTLLTSPNYVTMRQSVKLLAEILLDRTHYTVMTQYIDSVDNLKTVMNLLLQESVNIRYEAFHVFKIFVANPKKAPSIEAILTRNKDGLLTLLSDFLEDRKDDQFRDEKAFIIKQIQALS
jgi:calcium binding protein 39